MKALVVDDESTTRIVLQEILSHYAEVRSCENGAEAVEACSDALARGDPFDLICMDLMMPVMGGMEALKIIRQAEARCGRIRPRATKVVITTATNDTDSINQAFRDLCDAYVVKPIDPDDLLDVVHCLFPLKERPG